MVTSSNYGYMSLGPRPPGAQVTTRLVGYLYQRPVFSSDADLSDVMCDPAFYCVPYQVPATPPGTAATRKVRRLLARQNRAIE